MEEADRTILLQAANHFPPPSGVTFSYGTAGFRSNASLLSSTVFRVGVLAALRSLKTRSVIGLMITASHNPASDNGIKVADPEGGMLTQEWETFADAIANAKDSTTFVHIIDAFIKKEEILLEDLFSGEVLLARDTRPSGDELLQAAIQGVRSIKGVIATDMGILTTPQLHWMVRNRNKGLPASESDYFFQISNSARTLLRMHEVSTTYSERVVVDGANGVGAQKLHLLQGFLEAFEIKIRNSGQENEGILNDRVGADFVQKEKIAPLGFGEDDVGQRCASFDGDADRLVYFYISSKMRDICLVDGDKILTLFAIFIKQQLDSIKAAGYEHLITLGIVQTAYANGASTRYLKELGLEVIFTPTGVKHLHQKASEFDIGIYFEANGHGTILFSEKCLLWMKEITEKISCTSTDGKCWRAVQRLLATSSLINQAVGDALCGLVLVEMILRYMGWSIQRWNAVYDDFPSRQLKVKVPDRKAIITTAAETRVESPSYLQEAIDAEIAKHPLGRAFVRPSGTEDVVRVYAEALTQEDADALAHAICLLVQRYFGVETPRDSL